MTEFHGRERALEKFERIFAEVREGKRRNLFISGYSGVGKTTLVKKFSHSAEKKGALFVSVKSHTLQGKKPYSGITAALGMFVKKVVAGNSAGISDLKKLLDRCVSDDIDYAVNLVPEIGYLFKARRSEHSEEKQYESTTKFVLLKVLEAFAKGFSPLILFLDDLQWLDSASFDFLRYIGLNGSFGGLMLVMSFRSNELERNDDLGKVLCSYQKDENTEILNLKGLTKREVKRLLDSRFGKKSEMKPLAEISWKKTGGNPFFLNQFIDTLLEKGLLYKKKDEWVYLLSKINSFRISENVAAMLSEKLALLSKDTTALLKQASCINSDISTELLTVTSGLSPEQIEALLWKPLNQELLKRENGCYFFAHDKILESVAILLSHEERVSVNRKLADHYLETYSDGSETLYTITHHLALSFESFKESRERRIISILFFKAGMKAKKQSAYRAALDYFLDGLKFYPGDIWQQEYERALEFSNEAAECAYRCGANDSADKIFREIEAKAKSYSDRERSEKVKIPYLQCVNRTEEAQRTALALLAHLGLTLPEKPGKIRVGFCILKTWLRIALLNPHSRRRKLASGSRKDRLMRALSASVSISFFSSPQTILPILVCRGVDISLKHGVNRETPAMCICMAIILNQITGTPRWGRKLNRIAKNAGDEVGLSRFSGKEAFMGNLILGMWEFSMERVAENLKVCAKEALKEGDYEYAIYGFLICDQFRLMGGVPLNKIEKDLAERETLYRKLNSTFAVENNCIMRQTIKNLSRKGGAQWILNGEYFNERDLSESPVNGSALLLLKCLAAFFSGKPEFVLPAIEKLLKLEEENGLKNLHYIRFIETVTLLSCGKNPRKVKKNMKLLKRWARYNPEIFEGKYLLCRAEIMAAEGSFDRSYDLYKQAVSTLHKNGLIHEQAYACKRLGQELEKRGDEISSSAYLQKARELFKKWGLAAHHGLYEKREESVEMAGGEESLNSSNEVEAEKILESFYKKIKGFDSDRVLEETVGKVQDMSGAESVKIAVKTGRSWKTVAVGYPGGRVENPSISVDVPEKLFGFVAFTDEIVSSAEKEDKDVVGDPYFTKNRPESYTCFPIGRASVVYLENHRKDVSFNLLRALAGDVLTTIEKNCPDSKESGEVEDERPRESSTGTHEELYECCRKLKLHMEKKKSYRNCRLNIKTFAEQTGFSQRTVSEAINISLDRNFHTFLNGYRLEEVKRELRKKENSGKGILEIAFAAGFKSKSTFNDVFKTETGMTPTQFRRKCE